MALPMPIPPWLVTRPAEFAEASARGMNEGIAAAHIWAQARAEEARLAEAAKRSDLDAALEKERLQQKNIYDQQKLAADNAYSKAQIGLAQSKIAQAQANAQRMATQWAANNRLAQQRQATMDAREQLSEKRLDLADMRQATLDRRADEIERHNRAMEAARTKDEDPLGLKAYSEQQLKAKSGGGGILDRIKNLFSSNSPPAAAAAPADNASESPFDEGQYVTNKADGKTYVIKNGEPVPIDQAPAEKSN